MMRIEWRDEYAIDNGLIDKEHASLIEMANQIFAIEHPEARQDEITDLVKGLFRYMETHFEHEEQLMEQGEAPNRKAHAGMHRFFIEEMTRALKTHTDLREYTVVLRNLVGGWFINHITRVDVRIAEALSAAARQTPVLQ
jgi:hemerythrin-like metal-binding protein